MFVIYNTETERRYHRPRQYGYAQFETLRGAKTVATRMNKSSGRNSLWVAMSNSDYDEKYNPMVSVINIMSGVEVLIRKSEVGGCCDPSTERYHCM